jgi:ABC-type sulfate transport system permease subunit
MHSAGHISITAQSAVTARAPRHAARRDPLAVQWGLTLAALSTIALLIVVPVVSVFFQALADGPAAYWENLVGDSDTLHSISSRWPWLRSR